jgi:hypothetical protein
MYVTNTKEFCSRNDATIGRKCNVTRQKVSVTGDNTNTLQLFKLDNFHCHISFELFDEWIDGWTGN